MHTIYLLLMNGGNLLDMSSFHSALFCPALPCPATVSAVTPYTKGPMAIYL